MCWEGVVLLLTLNEISRHIFSEIGLNLLSLILQLEYMSVPMEKSIMYVDFYLLHSVDNFSSNNNKHSLSTSNFFTSAKNYRYVISCSFEMSGFVGKISEC